MSPSKSKRKASTPTGSKRTSIREIARLTGYSVTTVSMVLNGRAEEFNIAESTNRMILAAAAEHNYRPNLHARNLRTRTSNIVALMVPALTNRFFSGMAETFERLARESDKFALITVTHHDPQEELNAVDYFVSQNVDCIFTANPMALDEVGAACAQAGVRQIVIDAPESDKITVTTDNKAAARALTERLLASVDKSGRQGRVYYVGGTLDHAVTSQRLDGFAAALRAEGREFSSEQFVPTKFEARSAATAFRDLFETRDDVRGLFVNSLGVMEGLILYFPDNPEACRAVHYGVFDYHPIMGLLSLNVLSVMQDAERMMCAAFDFYTGSPADTGPRLVHIPHRIIPAPL